MPDDRDSASPLIKPWVRVSALTASSSGGNSTPYQTDTVSDSGEKIVSVPEHHVHSADMEPGRCWP